MKPVVWLGDSLARLREFPRHAMQDGREPKDRKPMSTIGAGVNELRIRAGGAFRVIYVANFAEAIYVLHAFEKKSRRTALLDIELARSRFRNLIRTRRSQ
jgi:phage-related protein